MVRLKRGEQDIFRGEQEKNVSLTPKKFLYPPQGVWNIMEKGSYHMIYKCFADGTPFEKEFLARL